MAHDAKLEIYIIYLNPTTPKGKNTFKSFLYANYGNDIAESKFKVEGAYKEFFKDFIMTIDDAYYSQESRKKAIGIKSEKKGKKINKTISYKSENQVIEGTIKGGRYGQNRAIGDMVKPGSAHQKLPKNKVVLDDFYFKLYTPFGSNKGILMIQSYSDDQINDIFISFIRDQLKTKGFYKPNITLFCPKHIQEEFKNNSVVKELRFREEVTLSDITKKTIDTKELLVEIKVTVKDSDEQLSTFDKIKKSIQEFSFKTNGKPIALSDFKTKMGTLANDKYQSSFDLDGDLEIKPTIYLKNRIKLMDDESPDWESLNVFCTNLLDTVKEEVYPENEISED